MTALQVVPTRQLAMLILGDVFGFHASDVAGMLDLDRRIGEQRPQTARASLQRLLLAADGREPPPGCDVAKFVKRLRVPISARWWLS